MPTDPHICAGCERLSPACTCVKDDRCGTCGTDLGAAAELQRDLVAENARLRERVAAVERDVLLAIDKMSDGYRLTHGGGGDYCRALSDLREYVTLGAHRTDDPLPSALADLTARLAREERDHGITIDQRDRASGAADALAYAIGTVEDIGEHSNLNDPWANALDHLDVILAAAREEGRVAGLDQIAREMDRDAAAFYAIPGAEARWSEVRRVAQRARWLATHPTDAATATLTRGVAAKEPSDV